MERRIAARNVKDVNFSYDIFYEILLRVPAEDLVRFKTVCKEWRSIISNPDFAQAHLAHCEPEFLFLAEQSCECKCYKINIRENKGVQQIHLPRTEVGIQFFLKSFCDGLLLLEGCTYHDRLTICNPVTRRLKHLPVPQNSYGHWGLVRDTSIGKYKVFGIDPYSQTCIGVLTQGGSTSTDWRYIDRTPRKEKNLRWTGPICILDKLHWTEIFKTKKGDHGFKTVSYVCSIDIAKEELREVEVGIVRTDSHILAEVGGSLCVVNICPGYFEAWVLTDDTNNLWTRRYRVSFRILCVNAPDGLTIEDSWDLLQYKVSVSRDVSEYFSESLYMLAHHEYYFYFYNGKNKKWRRLGRLQPKDSIGYRIGFHVNSVVNWE